MKATETKTPPVKMDYRIERKDKTLLNAGTGRPSWFTLERARELVDRARGQRIIESNGGRTLWEVL